MQVLVCANPLGGFIACAWWNRNFKEEVGGGAKTPLAINF